MGELMADGYFVTPQDAAQVETHSGVHRRAMAATDEAMLCEFFFEREAVVPMHSHLNDQIGYVIYGKVEVTIGGEMRVCQPGDSYAVPGGVAHNTRAVVDSLVIAIFSPPLENPRVEAR